MGLKKRNKVTAEFNMSSLTDIIFLLLIFFILTSTVVSPNALNLKLPGSSSKTVAPSSISVSITANREFYLDKTKVAEEELMTRIRAAVAQEEGTPENITIVINTDKNAPVEDLVKVMDIAYKLKVKAILATDPDV